MSNCLLNHKKFPQAGAIDRYRSSLINGLPLIPVIMPFANNKLLKQFVLSDFKKYTRKKV